MDPTTRGMIQRYSSLPVEKLQEMAGSMGSSPQGKIIQQVLQQKLAMPPAQQQQPAAALPQTQPTQAPAQQSPQIPADPTQLVARGGTVMRRADGGDMGISASQGMPSWTRSEASSMDRGSSGFLHGGTAGRTDAVTTQAPGGSYVIPAEVVAGIGEGNSLAGARFIQDAVSTGPWGTPLPRGGGGGRGLPHPVAPPVGRAGGGGLAGEPAPVPVKLSDGEFVIHPDQVMRIGDGDLKRGQLVLDHMVEALHSKHIRDLKKYPGPVKDGKE
jgi:hypothetical protein